MAEEKDDWGREELLEENRKLKRENETLYRDLNLANNMVEKYKLLTNTQENISAFITAEKSRQEKQLQVIMENTPDIVILLDSLENFLLSTQSFLKLVGISDLGLLHLKSFKQVFAAFTDETWLAYMEDVFKKAFEEGEIQQSEETIDIGALGNPRHYSVSAVPFSYEGDSYDGLLVVFSDLTDIIAARDHQEADRAKTLFLAKMSHEMRTPMNAIIGMSELVAREDIPPAAQEYVLAIKQAGAALLSLINDILDFSKIESGKLELVPAEYLFSALIDDVISIIKTKVLESRLRFVVNVDNDIPRVLLGDAVRIRQIMMNLLSNAVKYTDRGFIALSVTQEKGEEETVVLTIKVEDSGKGIKPEEIGKLFNEFTRVDLVENKSIEGTGLGLAITRSLVEAMSGEVRVQSVYGEGSTFTVTLPQGVKGDQKLAVVDHPEEKSVLIYERRDLCIQSIIRTMDSLGVPYKMVTNDSDFYNEITSRKYPYVFLASVLYDRLKEKYRAFETRAKFLLIAEFGETMVGRDASILTTPIYSLPVANFLNNVSQGLNSGAKYTSMTSFAAPEARTLVVDDIETNLQVAQGLLKPYNMQVDVCTSGKEAIRLIQQEPYDLVLMDHMMPEMNGIEAVARIRAQGNDNLYYATLPIVALTANAVSGTKEMFLMNGFDDFLSKPIDIAKLKEVLEKWIPADKQMALRDDVPGDQTEEDAAQETDAAGSGEEGMERDMQEAVEEEEDGDGDGERERDVKIEGLNMQKGVMMTGGSLTNYLHTLAVFHKDAQQRIQDMKTALAAQDLSAYRIYVHALKGAAASIGAEKLSDLARVMEMETKQENLAFILAHHPHFVQQITSLLARISAVTAQARVRAYDPGKSADREVLKAELSELSDALDEYDSGKIKEAVGRLRPLAQTTDAGVAVEDILRNVTIGEYEEAMLLIEVLGERLSDVSDHVTRDIFP